MAGDTRCTVCRNVEHVSCFATENVVKSVGGHAVPIKWATLKQHCVSTRPSASKQEGCVQSRTTGRPRLKTMSVVMHRRRCYEPEPELERSLCPWLGPPREPCRTPDPAPLAPLPPTYPNLIPPTPSHHPPPTPTHITPIPPGVPAPSAPVVRASLTAEGQLESRGFQQKSTASSSAMVASMGSHSPLL